MKDGEGFLSGLKKIGKELKQPAKEIGKEVGKEVINIAKEGAKQAVREKMSKSSKKEKEGGFLVTAGTIGATLLADHLMKKGNGIYSAGVRMSPQQSRNLRMGKGITLKKEMLDDAGRYAMDMGEAEAKKVMKALSKNKGIKITMNMLKNLVDKKTGGSIFGNIARVVAPIIAEKVIDKGADFASKKLEGAGHGCGCDDKKGDGIFASGAGFRTAGAGMDMMPIQTGSYAMLKSSPANKPFIDSGLLNGSKRGSGISKRGAGVCLK